MSGVVVLGVVYREHDTLFWWPHQVFARFEQRLLLDIILDVILNVRVVICGSQNILVLFVPRHLHYCLHLNSCNKIIKLLN